MIVRVTPLSRLAHGRPARSRCRRLAQRAATRYGVPAHLILQRAGVAGYVGGQEDMIIDIAIRLAEEQADDRRG